jgi:hypothetical protein
MCHLSVQHLISLFTYLPTYQPLFPFRYLTRLPTYLPTYIPVSFLRYLAKLPHPPTTLPFSFEKNSHHKKTLGPTQSKILFNLSFYFVSFLSLSLYLFFSFQLPTYLPTSEAYLPYQFPLSPPLEALYQPTYLLTHFTLSGT